MFGGFVVDRPLMKIPAAMQGDPPCRAKLCPGASMNNGFRSMLWASRPDRVFQAANDVAYVDPLTY
jgi:hypothetical protein